MQNPKHSQTLYHLRKSLLSLTRARSDAAMAENFETVHALKKCIKIITTQIKLLNSK
jgi:hypothetical protein